jgi:hypothetical protein
VAETEHRKNERITAQRTRRLGWFTAVAEAARLAGCSRQRLHEACQRHRPRSRPSSAPSISPRCGRAWSLAMTARSRVSASSSRPSSTPSTVSVGNPPSSARRGRRLPQASGAARRYGLRPRDRCGRNAWQRLFGRAHCRAAGRAEGRRPLRRHPCRSGRGRAAGLTAPRSRACAVAEAT